MKLDVGFWLGDGDFDFGTLSYQEDTQLIMAHASFLSAQWPASSTGVQLQLQTKDYFKLGFMGQGTSYQSFHLDMRRFEEVEGFFKELGFPVHRVMNHDAIMEQIEKD
jgi:hypothetical protein